MSPNELQTLARKHGTPLVVIDHDELRRNHALFREQLPKVQAYYAVKANPDPAILRTLYHAGASFDVASVAEFMAVYELIKDLPAKERQDFIWDKIIYANPTKPKETLQALDQYRPLVTYDNGLELEKIKQYAPRAGVVLRLRVPNTGSMVELSSKFGCDPGEAVDLIQKAFDLGLVVEGLSFSEVLNSGGEWYFHLKVQDEAGNHFLYHEGPWYVSTFELGQLIKIDGYLDLVNGEWDDQTELLDDDERALAGLVPGLFTADRQLFYTAWDRNAIYLGWRGAWWDLHGTMWAFVDTADGGSRMAPLPGLPELPIEADYALQISGSSDGRLWTFVDSEWDVSEQELDFAQGGGPQADKVAQALDLALQSLTDSISHCDAQ